VRAGELMVLRVLCHDARVANQRKKSTRS
jgi:hypothetical protein